MASSGARSSKVVTTTDAFNVVAAHAIYGIAVTTFGLVAESGASSSNLVGTGASSSDLVGTAPPSSNPGRLANGVHPKVSLAHGGPLPTTASSGKHDD